MTGLPQHEGDVNAVGSAQNCTDFANKVQGDANVAGTSQSDAGSGGSSLTLRVLSPPHPSASPTATEFHTPMQTPMTATMSLQMALLTTTLAQTSLAATAPPVAPSVAEPAGPPAEEAKKKRKNKKKKKAKATRTQQGPSAPQQAPGEPFHDQLSEIDDVKASTQTGSYHHPGQQESGNAAGTEEKVRRTFLPEAFGPI